MGIKIGLQIDWCCPLTYPDKYLCYYYKFGACVSGARQTTILQLSLFSLIYTPSNSPLLSQSISCSASTAQNSFPHQTV